MRDKTELLATCVALGALRVGGQLSASETELVRNAAGAFRPGIDVLERIRFEVRAGSDPLGDAFCAIRPAQERRRTGAFYTEARIVSAMVEWALKRRPIRVVDAGCGSGRFSIAARRLGFTGELLAVDVDPLATLITRAHLAAAGAEARVLNGDFLQLRLPPRTGRTAFLGNPPYVRHHAIGSSSKRWAKSAANRLGVGISGLAGLHALFALAAAGLSRHGDLGCFITAAEWLDVRYGAALRDLFAGPLGCVRLDMVEPRSMAFDDAMATAVITSWEVGYSGPVSMRRVESRDHLANLTGGRMVSRRAVAASTRWSDLFVSLKSANGRGLVPLGSFARVHRGVATGANDFFVLDLTRAEQLDLIRHVRPCLVRAAQVISAPGVVRAYELGHVLIDPDEDSEHDPALQSYLREGERRGVPTRYLCAHRSPWWRVGGSPAPPIVATYMARQPPKFAVNPDACQILNVFHGIHFSKVVESSVASALVHWLNAHRDQLVGGRTYQGGLRKFEPRELEAILVPPLDRAEEWGDE